MPTSSPTAPRPRTAPSFLFRGPPGGGKTTMLLQFPGLWIADIDINLNGPENYLRNVKKVSDLTYDFDTIFYEDDQKTPVLVHKAWERLNLKVDEAIKKPHIKVLGIDGLTHLNNILIRWVMDKWKITADGATMEQQHWIPFRNEMLKIIMKCRTAGKIVVFLCHEEVETDRLGVVVKYKVALNSRLKDYFGGFFTDIYAFTQTPGPGDKPKFECFTGATTRRELKNSFNMPTCIDVTTDGFAALNKYMQLEKLQLLAPAPVAVANPTPTVVIQQVAKTATTVPAQGQALK